jgi:hypothetical protein
MYLTSMKMTGSDIPATLPDEVRNEIRNAVAVVQGNGPQQAIIPMAQQQQQHPTGIPSFSNSTTPQLNTPSQPTGFSTSTPTGMYNNTNLQAPMMTGITPMMNSGGPQVVMPTGMAGNNMDFTNRMMPHSGNYIPPSSFESLSKNVKIPWAVTNEEKKQYTKIFKAWDTEKRGVLTGDTAKEIFSQSGLPQNVLMQIW